MIDGILVLVPWSYLLDLLFKSKGIHSFEESAGVITSETISHKGLSIRRCASGKALIRGSIHTYLNNGQHNSDHFTYGKLIQALSQFSIEFGVSLEDCRILSLEYGLNIELPFPVKEILSNVVALGYREFSTEKNRRKNMVYLKQNRNEFKLYDKGLQYSQVVGPFSSLVRIEIKHRKMLELNAIGIFNLADLQRLDHFDWFALQLQKFWNRVILHDISIRLKELTIKEQRFVLEARHPAFWMNLNKDKRKREKIKHRQLMALFSDDRHTLFSDSIKREVEELKTATF